TRGKDIGKTFTVTEKKITIGRDFSNSIRLEDVEVSRLHCSILFEADKVTLVDEGSSNGTFVNGVLVGQSPLVRGDKIQVGKTQIIFDSFLQIRTDPDNASPATASPTRVIPSSHEATRFGESGNETRPISLKLDTDHESTYEKLAAKAGTQEAGRQFVQVKNDLRFVYRASLATTRTLDTPQMLRELMGLIFDWVEADRGCVFLKEPNQNKFTIKYVKDRHEGNSARSPSPEVPNIKINKSVVEYVIREKVGIISPPNVTDVRLKSKGSTIHPLIGEVMCVPIECRGELFGLLYVDTIANAYSDSNSRFSMDHLRLMLTIAHQAAVSIENEGYYRAIIERERHSAVAELTGVMSHRINNILQGLNGGSHLLQSGLDQSDLELCRKGWEIAQKNQGQISNLVIDLLLLSKPLELAPRSSDVAEIIEVAIDNSRCELTAAGMKCHFKPDPGSWNFLVDQELLTTGLENLIRLAIQGCAKENPKLPIEIQMSRVGQTFEIRIHYRGLAICRENSLVASFNETVDSATPPFQSASLNGGIELAVGEKIVSGHNGTVELSKHPEVNQITVRLPVRMPIVI
ncbi:MAG: FHA domain-containing protein, partial [Mariniblastus sp.]|nr:FHA domain-containing protein [Mariniblastus sp.]